MFACELILDALASDVAVLFEGEEGKVAEEVVLALRELEVLVDLLHSGVGHLFVLLQDLGDPFDDVQTSRIDLFFLHLSQTIFRHEPQRRILLCLLLKDLESKAPLTLFFLLLLLHYPLHRLLQNTAILYQPSFTLFCSSDGNSPFSILSNVSSIKDRLSGLFRSTISYLF